MDDQPTSSTCQVLFTAKFPAPKVPLNLDRIRELLSQQRRFLSHASALQPNNARSFSQPELRINDDDDKKLIGDFKAFRDQLLEQTTSGKWPLLTRPCLTCNSTERKPSETTVEKKEEEEQPYSGKSSLWSTSEGYDQLQLPSYYDSSTDNSTPPVPKPRKSVLHRRAHREAKKALLEKETKVSEKVQPQTEVIREEVDAVQLDKSLSSPPQLPSPNLVTPQPQKPSPPTQSSLLIPSEQTTILPISSSVQQQQHQLTSQSTKRPQAKVKTKAHSFRQQILRINRIASNKLLSIRLKSDSLSRKKASQFFGFSDHHQEQQQTYRRPTRTPPPTPILIFRPAAPLPGELPPDPTDSTVENSSFSLTREICEQQNTPTNRWFSVGEHRLGNSSSSPPSTFEYDCKEDDDISELYHDAAFFQSEEKQENENDIESLYCSVDESIVYKLKRTSKLVGDTNGEDNKNGGDKVVEEEEEGDEEEDGQASTAAYDDYYDDGECIYEELSSNEGTIYEEYIEEEEENLYDNADALPPPLPPPPETEKSIELAQKQMKKRLKKIEKAMRRFKLKGDEIPVNAGIVKRDQRSAGLVTGSLVGQNPMLKVRAGETVLIIRMNDNPPGLWLGKNERSKIGYVECNNVFFDSQSIKDVIMGFHNT